MWGAFICGVGAIPVLLAMNAFDERAAMAPPPAARALAGVTAPPAPGPLPSWTPPVASATGGASSVREPARTGTLPAQMPPALADGPKSPAADPIQPSRAVASDSTGDSVPLPRPGEPRLPVSPGPDVSPASAPEIVGRSDAPPADPAVSSATVSSAAQEPGPSRASPNPEPVQSANATDPLPSPEKSAPDAVSSPDPDLSPRSRTKAAASEPASRSRSGPGLPPVRPVAPAQAQPLPSDRVEFASEVAPPPKRHEPPKRHTPTSKRRKAPPSALPAIPLEQQFEWIQQ
jgi:hypothetical protein